MNSSSTWSCPLGFPHLVITDELIRDDPNTDVLLTSANFKVNGDTFRVNKDSNAVSDELVKAIQNARTSILIASGHLRSRPISEALIAKRLADPNIEIRMYLDGQEYISRSYNTSQERDVATCLDAASTQNKIRDCLARGFLFGFVVGQAGIDVRYKYYSYRWHFSYAVQMHNKYMLIDGKDLYTGSYNYSNNAEQATFENVLVFRGPEYAGLIAQFKNNFNNLWNTGRDEGLLADLLDKVRNDNSFPIVFSSMALTWQEVNDLKSEIMDNCAEVNTEAFRSSPESHKFCTR